MVTALTALLLAGPAQAIPGQFTHQGRLWDATGLPLSDEATLTFRVMDSETDGDIVWEETLTLALNNGFYAAVLGADEASNPLDVDVFSQAPVWLEVQVADEAPMSPRSAIHSVPYATMATVAEEVSGGPVNASRVAIDGTLVIDASGEWVGPSAPVTWSDIEGMPADFADGIDNDTDTDTDTLADLGLSCVDGDIPVWDAVMVAWICDEDQDTLASMTCGDGEIIRWSSESENWICDTDIDTDTTLSEEDVDAMVADNGYVTSSDLGSGAGGTIIYTRCAWTGDIMRDIGTCTPPACPAVWEDLGVTGNVKATAAAYGSADYDPSYSESGGYQERACFLENPVTVLTTRCAWTGDIMRDIGSCTPPDCPPDWTDQGITGNVKTTAAAYGSADYDPSYSESGGYQERTCTR